MEHYEIASYGTLCAYAKILNEKEALDLLLRTLGEEKITNGDLDEFTGAIMLHRFWDREMNPLPA